MWSYSVFEQSEQNEALETLEKQLQESKSELEEIQKEKSQLTEELQEYVRKLNSELQAKGALKVELDEATKVCKYFFKTQEVNWCLHGSSPTQKWGQRSLNAPRAKRTKTSELTLIRVF